MNAWLIAYATREGQTRHIAEHIARHLEKSHVRAVIVDLSSVEATAQLALADYEAVILAASVHNRRHEPEAVAFARRHASALNSMPCAVISVSSIQIVAESPRCSHFWRTLAAREANQLLARFCEQTGVRPTRVIPVAGALAYTKYSLMQRITFQCFARLTGLPTDASRDSSATNFTQLGRHIDAMFVQVRAAARYSVSSSRTV